jgi:hypothetical protein
MEVKLHIALDTALDEGERLASFSAQLFPISFTFHTLVTKSSPSGCSAETKSPNTLAGYLNLPDLVPSQPLEVLNISIYYLQLLLYCLKFI